MTKYQEYYWAKPDECRKMQRAKYLRYPEKIKAMNKEWQSKHSEYFKALGRFNSKIHYYRVHGDLEKVEMYLSQKNEFKSRNHNI